MELQSFKSLLLKKAEGNENLQTLIRLIGKEELAEEIIESLEKMASHKGDKANSAITGWAGSATGADVSMLHDALSHHLSKFAAANKARPPQTHDVEKKISMTDHSKGGTKQELPYQTKHVEMDPVAHQHLERAMHLADLAARASKHSLGKLNFDHVPTQAWEMNETSAHQRVNQHGQKKYADDQQGLKRRLQGKGAKRFENYGYLMQEPHDSYANKGKLRGHTGQYPFEDMKINDKHVHIDPNTSAPDQFESHPFDSHPLFNKEGREAAWEKPESVRSDADRDKYAQQLESWQDHPEFNKWLDNQEAEETKDPKAYAEKGSSPSALLEGVKRGQPKADMPEESAQEAVAKKPVPEQPKPAQEVKRRAAPAEKSTKTTKEDLTRLLELQRAKVKNPNDPKIKAEYEELTNKFKQEK